MEDNPRLWNEAVQEQSVTVALTGASGACYGLRLVERLLGLGLRVDLLWSHAAEIVLLEENHQDWRGETAQVALRLREQFHTTPDRLRLHGLRDWHSPLASGSNRPRRMVICPCSMGTLAAIAHGLSDNLIERAADVALKEGWPLLLVPREAPLSVLHLENMLRLARMGVTILPASPAFYHRPQQVKDLVDFIVNRILARLGLLVGDSAGWYPEGGE